MVNANFNEKHANQRSREAFPYRANVRGPHTIVTIAAASATSRPVMRGSQCEP